MLKIKQHIALFFFLTFFIIIKFVGSHALVFHDDQHYEDCNLCEFIITSNSNPVTIDYQILVEHPTIQHNYNKQLFYDYSYKFVLNQITNTLFCRPPPTGL